MRGGFAFSVGVHATILLLIILGVPFFRVKAPELPPMISVELVEIGKQTTTNKISPVNKVEKEPREETPPPEPKPQPAPEPTPPAPQPPQPQPESAPPRPAPQPMPKLASVDNSVPDLDVPKVDLKKPMAPAPELQAVNSAVPKLQAPEVNLKRRLESMPKLASVDPSTPDLPTPAKVDLKRPQPKPTQENFDNVLKNLSKLKPEASQAQPTQQPTKVAAHAPSGAQAPLAANLTASELSALSQQLARCWSLPAAAKDAQNLIVDLDVTVNPDRTVASARVVDQGKMSDPVYRAAAMAAIRAIRMPQCTPLALPPEKYQEWQSMNLHFDPKEMLGQ